MPLSETWFLDGDIDFELQKYKLLAYLQEVGKHFNNQRLYPQLSDVIFHFNNLRSFQQNKELLQDSFPKTLSSVDIQNLKLVYQEMLQDSDIMQELALITNYALSQIQTTINNGTELYEHIESQLNIEPVGIVPLYKNEGYMFLKHGRKSDVYVYNYTISLFTHQDERYRSIRVSYVDSWTKNISNTYEHIKADIVKTIKTLPNPAVYCIASPVQVPFQETLLPIAKRLLVRYLNKTA